MTATNCKSCTMPIENGDYCQYCADESGNLHAFEETLTRFMQFARRRDAGLSEADARAQTLAFMKQQPAWRDHPGVN